MVWYSHLLKNFPPFIVIHTVRDFGIVNKAEVDVFLEFSCFLYDPTNVGNLTSGSSVFSKPSLYIWKISVHVLLKIMEKAREFEKNIYLCFIDYAKASDCLDHNKLWKILQEMGISEHLTCLLRNLNAGQEATVRTRHGTMDWFQIGKGVFQGCILSLPAYLTDMQSQFSSGQLLSHVQHFATPWTTAH